MALTTNQAIADQVSLAYFGRPQDTGALAIFGAGLVNGSPTAAQLATQFATAESKVVFGALSTMSSVIAKSFELVGRVATSQNVTDLSTWATANNLAVSQMPWEIMKIALATESLLPQASQVAWARLAVAYQFSEDVTANSTALQNLATSTTSQDAARAVINGVTSFATIATAYPATGSGTVANFITGTSVVAGQTFTLTTGVDSGAAFTGTAGNDTFNATQLTLTAFDSINGGSGTDTLNITNIPGTAYALPVTTTTISGIENFVLSHGADTNLADAVSLNVSTLSDARSVVATALEADNITVTGSANLTSVAISGAGVAVVVDSGTNGAATTDKIATVTLSGVTGIGTLTSEALTTLNLTSAAGTVTNTDTDATVARTLTVNFLGGTNSGAVDAGATTVNVLTGGTVASVVGANNVFAAATSLNYTANAALTSGTVVAAEALTLNVTANAVITATTLTTAKATTVNVAANAAITAATLGAATTTALNLSGSSAMTITQTAAAAGVITSTGTGARTLVTALEVGQLYTGADGADTITVGATTKAITTNAGDDVITLTSATLGVGGSINAGAAGSDTLSTTAAIAITASATAALGTTFAAAVTGFEKLVLTGGANGAVDVSRLGNFTDISSAGDTLLTLGGVTSGSTLRLTATGTAQTVSSTAALLAGTNDNLNLVLTGALTADVAFSTTGLTATDIESINITSSYKSSMTAAEIAAAPAGGFENGMIILGNQAKTIVVGGAAGLNLVAASTALTSLDASSNTVGALGNFSWTSGATTAAVTVKGLAAGINTIVLSAATVAGTYTGSANGDTVTIANALANVLNLGDGTNLVNGAATGNNVVTGGAGADTFITATIGNNVVNFGNGANAFTATTGNNTYTGGTGVDTVTVTSGNNTISTGAGADVISVGAGLNVVDVGADSAVDAVTISAVGANGNTYTTITNIAVGDTIDLSALTEVARADAALGVKITLADTAAFADYLAAGTATIIVDAAANTIKWFQFSGNTYIVVDSSKAANAPDDTNGFENGIDSVVKLTGLIDLARSTTATDVLTIVV